MKWSLATTNALDGFGGTREEEAGPGGIIRHSATLSTLVLIGGWVSGFTIIVSYTRAVEPDRALLTFALLFAYSVATVMAGGAIGFLFGVPRRASADAIPERGTGNYPNTNLEQVSDWLTKILVGVTLTQLSNLPTAAAQLFDNMALPLGGGDAAVAAVAALVTFHAIYGFMFGWLATRAWMSRMLDAFDRANLEPHRR